MLKLALFDLDHTLLPLDSDYAWGKYTTHLGWTDDADFQRMNERFFSHYQAGELDIAEYVRFATAAVRARGAAEAERGRAQFMQEVILPAIQLQALALVQQHRDAGETTVIVTATNEWVVMPIAARFPVDDVIAIRLQRDAQSRITGEIEGTPSFAAGKVVRVEQWLSARGLGWADAAITFYSDSLNDLPLLERVQQPVATNPDPRLRALALQRGWRVLDLFGSQE